MAVVRIIKYYKTADHLITDHSEYFKDMLLKIFVVVLLAGQCVDGNETTLLVRESMINFCFSKNDTSHNTTCPIGSESCYGSFDQGLANISSNSTIKITTDSTLSFHNILQGLQNIRIIGYNNPTVYCYNTSTIIGALYFISCTNCTIQGITWSGCGGIVHDNNYPVLEFDSSSNVKIEKCTFKRSKGQAIVLSGMRGDVTINDCQFYDNKYLGNAGGAVIDIAEQGNYQMDVTVKNCNFTDNEGTSSIINIDQSTVRKISFHDFTFSNNIGTAIYLNHQDLHLYGEAYFKNNSARMNGGGMFVTNNSNVYFDENSSVEFNKNSANNSGGAIFLSNSTISLGKISKFINNQAIDGGGAMALYDNAHINKNYSDNPSVHGDALFSDNCANNGGAISLNNYSTVTFGSNSAFVNNRANKGGAITLHDNCGITNEEKSIVRFKGNIAQETGGALHLSEYSKTSFVQNSNITFDANSASSSDGAVILSESYSNVTFQGNSTVAFYNNSPHNGTLLSISNSFVTIMQYAYVTFNTQISRWYYGNWFTESNDVIIDVDGIVRCSDYREYYICSDNQACSCKDIANISSNAEVRITDDLLITSLINLTKLHDISFIGFNNATISGEFQFVSCRNLKIKDLTWEKNSKLTFSHVYDIMINNCSFQNLIGQVISLSSVSGYVSITHCNFKHNKDGMSKQNINDDVLIYYKPDDTDNTTMFTIENSSFNDSEYSSLIFLEPSSKKSDRVVVSDSLFAYNRGHCIYGNYQNLYIKKTVLFTNNKAQSGAGIYITNNSTITFCDNSNVTFHHNQAENHRGGAIFADNSDIVIQHGSRLQFSNNEADQGGAVYSTNTSTLTLEETSIMELSGNIAAQNGGAIYLNTNCKILINGASFFRSNRAIEGGAIYSKDNSVIKFQNDAESEFVSNKATRNGEQSNGGALYLDSSSIKFAEGSKIIFNKNIAYGHGGAIYSNSSDVTFMNSSIVIFYDNNATVFNGDGGAIFFASESDATFQGMSAVTFTSNRARNGGALHFQNSSICFIDNSRVVFSKNRAIQYGGGIYLHEINILFNDYSNVNFTDNNAENGGGIYAETNCTITSEGSSNMTFNSNTAVHGAGIYLVSNSYLFIKETSEIMMLENKATENGGGIYSQANSRVLFGSNFSIVFNNNKATQGGAIYSIEGSNVTFQSPVTITFNQNEALRYGGSLYLEDNSTVKFEEDSTVTYCKSKASNGNGGAIYCTDNSVVLIQEMSNVTFNENMAIDGGALYFEFESSIVFHNNSLTTFNNNTATTSGGAIHFETNSQGIFEGTASLSFFSNSATKSGGAMYLGNNVSLSFDNGNPINASKMFSQNNAETGGAIFLMNSEIEFDNNSVTFDNNTARQDGGAIYSDQSNLSFNNDCNIKFSNNRANEYGGAIYGIFDIKMDDNAMNISSTNIKFEKNDARIAGDSIYINLPQECEQECLNSSILGNVNDIIKHIITSPNELKLYAPTRCIDTNNEECQVYYIDNIMLGQEILLDACMYDYYDKEAAAAAQFLVSAYSNGNESVGNDNENFILGLNTTTISCNHTVPDIRINAATKDKPKLPHNYTLNFNLFARRFSETKMVFAELTVELSECHEGFYYDEGACQCYDTGNIVICTGSSSIIRRGYWFGEVDGNPRVTFCPINYCNFSCCETSNGFYQLSPTRENQCRLHRIGVACGKCEPGYTLPYDSPDCIEASDCTTTNISLAVTLTVIYWVVLFVLVFILMHFKVELGYLYGVTYYYSIIDIMLSQNLQLSNGFFTVVNILSSVAKVTPQFLGGFCLFKEMSGIDQQFIHYVHPVAFSLILVMIIMLAKFSGRLTEFISRAIIPIICFLLLLSYTSIATTSLLLMRPLMFEGIDKVYTYLSPDLEYFHGRHLGYAILAVVSTIAIVIFPPTLLSLEPYLNRYINFVKVKPILDQFQGCYKDKYRSFAAYYMICRLVIITLIIANSSSDNFVIQYSLIAVCVIIALVHLLIRPYSQLVLNVFDGIVLHIMILVAVIPFVRHYDNSDSNSATILAYILVLLPLTIFIAMEISINKESIKKMIQTIKSFKLKKEKSKNRNEIPLNDVNHEIGIIVDESMRRNALIVDVDRPEDHQPEEHQPENCEPEDHQPENRQPEEPLPKIPWSRDSFIEILNEIKD